MKKLILASQSPRREMLLKQIGLQFEVYPSNIDEILDPRLSPREQVESLSKQKALAVAPQFKNAIILAADTMVELDGKPIGSWDRRAFDLLVKSNRPLPGFASLYEGSVIPAGGVRYPIYIDPFKDRRHYWFWELVAHRVTLEVRYESLYGGEGFSASIHPREPNGGNLL